MLKFVNLILIIQIMYQKEKFMKFSVKYNFKYILFKYNNIYNV